MLIRLRLIDPDGTTHEVGGVRYHFGPREHLPAGIHIAEVANPDHAARFLAIDGFELWGEAPQAAKPAEAESDETAEAGPDFKNMSREELGVAYRNLFGRAPHWNLAEETMRNRLRAGTED